MRHTRPLTKCRSCKADIQFKETRAGKQHPVDMPRVKVLTIDGDLVEGRIMWVVVKLEDGTTTQAHVSHFSTCPDAAKYSGRGKKKEPVQGELLPESRRQSSFRTHDTSDGRCGLCGRQNCSGGCFR